MGCKSPSPGGSSFGPARSGGKGKGSSSPYGKSGGKGSAVGQLMGMMKGMGGGMGKGGGGGEWSCPCGFTNRPQNDVCGGGGHMGCKAPRQGGMSRSHSMPSFGGGGFGGGGGGAGGPWMCSACGFQNKPHNEMCGGNGPMGCKAPPSRGGGGFNPMMMMMKQQQAMVPMMMQMMPMKGGGKGKNEQGGWVCACGFKNGPRNNQCGGTGPMGCDAEKPSDWECAGCKFKNKPSNEVCGGRGPMGCKEPRPE